MLSWTDSGLALFFDRCSFTRLPPSRRSTVRPMALLMASIPSRGTETNIGLASSSNGDNDEKEAARSIVIGRCASGKLSRLRKIHRPVSSVAAGDDEVLLALPHPAAIALILRAEISEIRGSLSRTLIARPL